MRADPLANTGEGDVNCVKVLGRYWASISEKPGEVLRHQDYCSRGGEISSATPWPRPFQAGTTA